MTAENFLVHSYLAWIKSAVSAEQVSGDVTELTTPFLDRHNDYLQVYAERSGEDGYLLTDDGYIFSELKASGVENRGSKREELLNYLASGYGVAIQGSELQITATRQDIGQRLHALLQAMLSIDDMFVLAQSSVQSIFIEDVAQFLDAMDIRYTPRAKFAGRSGLDHMMDFVIPKSRDKPERIVQVVNSPRRDRIENILFAINDTRSSRGIDTRYFALINDTKRTLSQEMDRAFAQYEVVAHKWSMRELLVESLAA